MTHLENKARPKGQRDDYRFIKDADSGRSFKVLSHLEETLGRDAVLKLSISEIDENGHAIIFPGTKEPPLFWHSHTFTSAEIESPDFDVEKRVAIMLRTAIEADNGKAAAKVKIAALASKWRSNQKLDLTSPPEPTVDDRPSGPAPN